MQSLIKNRNMLKKCLPLLVLAFSSNLAFSKVVLPHIFNNNMVLKQKSTVNLWGKASSNKKVQVTVSWNKYDRLCHHHQQTKSYPVPFVHP